MVWPRLPVSGEAHATLLFGTAVTGALCAWALWLPSASGRAQLSTWGLLPAACGAVTPTDVLLQYTFATLSYWLPAYLCLLVDVFGERAGVLGAIKYPQPGFPQSRWSSRGLRHGDYRKAFVVAGANTAVSIFLSTWLVYPLVARWRGEAMCEGNFVWGGGTRVSAEPAAAQGGASVVGLMWAVVTSWGQGFADAARIAMANGGLWRVGQNVVLPAAVVAVASDAVFYVTHRLCHEVSFLYRRVHKLHHTWVDSVGAAAVAAHPFEHWFVNLHVAHLPGIIAGVPFHWHTFWLVVASATTVYTHCGFRLPLVAAHDRHHHFHDCEYGADILCDRLCRTTFSDRFPKQAAAAAAAA